MESFEELGQVHNRINLLEEKHNAVLDAIHSQNIRNEELKEHIKLEAKLLKNKAQLLQKKAQEMHHKLRSTVNIISLLAESQEFEPIKNRIEMQPYEQYIDKHWFISQIHERRNHAKKS